MGRLVKSVSVTPANLVAKPPKMEPSPPDRLLTDMSAAYSDASTPGGQMFAAALVGRGEHKGAGACGYEREWARMKEYERACGSR